MSNLNENKINELELRVLRLEEIITKLTTEKYRCNETAKTNIKSLK